ILENDALRGEVLRDVVTDAYFLDARAKTKEAAEKRDNEDAQRAAKDAWEKARCTAWALVFYLAEERKLHTLFRYGDELDRLPRDMDLNRAVLQGSFAKAFAM